MIDPATVDAICERIATGESARSVLRSPGMPTASEWWKLLSQNKAVQEQYARAKMTGLDAMEDALLEIADDGTNDTYETEDGRPRTDYDVIQRSKLRVDTRKWIMSKLAPKKYGDALDLKHSGDVRVMIDAKDAEA